MAESKINTYCESRKQAVCAALVSSSVSSCASRPSQLQKGDAFACLNGPSILPFNTRQLTLRGHYLYLYDSLASSAVMCGGNVLAVTHATNSDDDDDNNNDNDDFNNDDNDKKDGEGKTNW